MEYLFTEKYFLNEISQFRVLFGKKDFLDDHIKREGAIKGLTYVYLNTKPTSIVNSMFKLHIDEYNLRMSYHTTRKFNNANIHDN
jgi:hypothetical protein